MKIMKRIIMISVLIGLSGSFALPVSMKGKLIIPSATGSTKYPGVITFSDGLLEITCEQKIFQLFNEFDTPKSKKLIIDLEEIADIKIYRNTIYLFPSRELFRRYRNLFNYVYMVCLFCEDEEKAMVFESEAEDNSMPLIWTVLSYIMKLLSLF